MAGRLHRDIGPARLHAQSHPAVFHSHREDGRIGPARLHAQSHPAVFHSHREDGRMLVHGDVFVLLADDGEIKAVEQLLKSKYTVKVVSVIGDGSLQQEAVILNRIVRYVPPNEPNRMAMEIEPDQRHVDILLREHGLDDSRSKGVDTPRVKKSESQVFAGLESLPLDREGVRLYGS